MNKLGVVIKMAVADELIYRTDILIFVLAGVIRPIVMILLWLAAINSGAKTPFSKEEFIQYYLLVMFVDIVVGVWSSPFISAKIRSGRISPYFIRPFNYIFFDLGNNIGEKIFKFLYLLPILAILSWAFHANPINFNIVILLVFLLSLINAFAINYLLDICVGLFAFWIDDIEALRETNDLLGLIFSGFIFPLAILPIFVQQVALILPFRYTLSFPIEILMGKLSNAEIITGLGIGTFWTMAIVMLTVLIWRKGIKKYSAMGD